MPGRWSGVGGREVLVGKGVKVAVGGNQTVVGVGVRVDVGVAGDRVGWGVLMGRQAERRQARRMINEPSPPPPLPKKWERGEVL